MRSVFAPPMRLAGRIIGAIETIGATKLGKGWPKEENPDAGSRRTARPDSRENWLNSIQWRIATQLRLGIWNEADDLRCRHTDRQEEVCDKPIGKGRSMKLDWKHSPARIKIHNSVCESNSDVWEPMWRSAQCRNSANGSWSSVNGSAKRRSWT